MILHTVIIENETTPAKELRKYIKFWSDATCCDITVTHFKSAEAFLKKLPKTIDILFLDIELSAINGMDLAKKLRKKQYNMPIVFVTNYKDYVFEGYDVHAFHYLLKPVNPDDIKKCLDFVYDEVCQKEYIFVFNNNTSLLRIPYDTILYFSASNHYIDIHTKDGKYSQKKNLKELFGTLPPNFLQCHRTMIVNMKQVEKIVKDEIILSNGTILPLSATYTDSVRKAMLASMIIL